MIRRHYADEEPDSDEIERDWWSFEGGDLCAGTCSWCGHSGHRKMDCPNRPPSRGLQAKRRTKAEQLAAARGDKPLDDRT